MGEHSKACGNLVLNKSGEYCVACDLKGTLTLDHDNICLDLCCHEIDGQGAAAAITATGLKDISIKNGAVTNAGSLGINLERVTGGSIDDVQFYGTNNALIVTGSSCSTVSNVKAYDNFNTSGAVIFVDDCDTVTLSHVEACSNTKELTEAVGTTNPAVGIITIFNSQSIALERVLSNSNSQTNDNARFAPLALLFNSGVTVKDAQTSFNTITVANTRGFAPLYVRANFGSIVVDGLKANENFVGASDQFRPVYFIDSPQSVITHAQVNNNYAELLLPNLGDSADFIGIFVFTVGAVGVNDVAISDSQVAGNIIESAGEERENDADLVGLYVRGFSGFLDFQGRTTISRVQVNDNSMLSTGNFQNVAGLQIEGAKDVTVSDSSFDGNNGGSLATGATINSTPESGLPNSTVGNIKLTNITANNTYSEGVAAGIWIAGAVAFDEEEEFRTVSKNCIIVDSQVNENVGGKVGHGIVLEGTTGCSVINTQTDANSHNGVLGGQFFFEYNTINKDNCIINCSAKNNGANGYMLNASATNENFLFDGNRAVANDVSGFVDQSRPRTNIYQGNYATKNGKDTNYDISDGAIALQTLDVTAGIYSNKGTGDPRLSSQSNVQAIKS